MYFASINVIVYSYPTYFISLQYVHRSVRTVDSWTRSNAVAHAQMDGGELIAQVSNMSIRFAAEK